MPRARDKHLCVLCKKRKRLSAYKRVWKIRKHHDLCPQCWRTTMDQTRNKGGSSGGEPG